MLPFDRYPSVGRALTGRLRRGDETSRGGYGLDLAQRTHQTHCAYCGLDLVHSFEHWLLLSVDHVVPQGAARAAGIPADFYEDIANLVLACQGCNGFLNRFIPELPVEGVWTEDQFLIARDRIFVERRSLIAQRREIERQLFDSEPWVALRESTDRPSPRLLDGSGTVI